MAFEQQNQIEKPVASHPQGIATLAQQAWAPRNAFENSLENPVSSSDSQKGGGDFSGGMGSGLENGIDSKITKSAPESFLPDLEIIKHLTPGLKDTIVDTVLHAKPVIEIPPEVQGATHGNAGDPDLAKSFAFKHLQVVTDPKEIEQMISQLTKDSKDAKQSPHADGSGPPSIEEMIKNMAREDSSKHVPTDRFFPNTRGKTVYL